MMGAAGAASDPLYVDDVFSTFLFTANGNTGQTITNDIDLSNEGGLVWHKSRDNTYAHVLWDTERGGSTYLESNTTGGATTNSNMVTFNSNGYSVNKDTGNEGTDEHVSWTFRKAPGFFDIVTYTGNGTGGNTISHNLGSVPGFIMVKRTSGTDGWFCYHRSLGNTKMVALNGTGAAGTAINWWNNTSPTDSAFTVGTDTAVNADGQTYIAYIFAHDDQSFGTDGDESIIKCESVTGDSNGDFTVNLGFEPQWLLTKFGDATGNWTIHDTMRGFGVTNRQELFPNTNGAEVTQNNTNLTITNTGFVGDAYQQNSKTLIYIAIRRPHKPPSAATDVFSATYNSASNLPWFRNGNFPVDFTFYKEFGYVIDWYQGSRLQGTYGLRPSSNAAEANISTDYWKWDYMDGWNAFTTGSNEYISYQFKRAPGFFDVVFYTGNSTSGNAVSHNLGVAPEMIWVKGRNLSSQDWAVYHSATGTSKYLKLNGSGGALGVGRITGTSNSTFTLDSDDIVNKSGDPYIAILFATLPGVSKVGTFSGTGSDINVDCGFTAGARFVMIKRTDSSGGWYIWDTTRGIVSGNDPYHLVNSTAVQVTNTDYIDPLNAGFTVTSSASAELNASGGTYLFFAIA